MANRNAGANAQKSRAEHERAGTFRKDRHGDLKSPEPTAGRPEPPVELSKTAQEEWDRMLWAFEDMGMLHKVDVFAVYQYCQLYAETEAVSVQQAACEQVVERLDEKLPDLEATALVEAMSQIVNLRKLISKCTDQLRSGRMAIRQYLVEFGLTPAARGRIKLPPKTEKVDSFTARQRARPVLVK